MIVVAINMTPVERNGYRIGLPAAGHWDEILCTDAETYGGGNRGNGAGLETEAVRWHDRDQSALIDIPPLSAVVFRQA